VPRGAKAPPRAQVGVDVRRHVTLFETALPIFFWLWAGYASAFTVIVWLGLLNRERQLRQPSVPFLVWPLCSLFAVGGLLGLARIWALTKPESDFPNALALIAGIALAGASFGLRIVRTVIARSTNGDV